MKLNELRDNPGARRPKLRICRGIGSGKGKTGGRGGKGQTARTGVSINGFEGGQMPLFRRLPKRGFKNIFTRRFAEVNLSTLEDAIKAGTLNPEQTITGEKLIEVGILHKLHCGIKLLAKGTLSHKVTIEAMKASQAALKAIENAGGKVILPVAAE